MNATLSVCIILWQGQVFLTICRFKRPVAIVRLILMAAGLAGMELEGERSAEKKRFWFKSQEVNRGDAVG